MTLDRATAKRIFLITTTICVVFFGIPFLVYFFKIVGGLFWQARLTYIQAELPRDLFLIILFGALAAIPPLVVYLYFGLDKQTSTDAQHTTQGIDHPDGEDVKCESLDPQDKNLPINGPTSLGIPLRNAYAIAGLLLGIVSVFLSPMGLFPILAVILSGFAIYKAHWHGWPGKIPACMGLILGTIYTMIYLISYGYGPVAMDEKKVPLQTKNQMERPVTTPIKSSALSKDPLFTGYLMLATQEGKGGDVKSLLQEGADPNIRLNGGVTVLMVASKNGEYDIVKLLVRYGADVNARDFDGWTPLRYARKWGTPAVVSLLMDYGAME